MRWPNKNKSKKNYENWKSKTVASWKLVNFERKKESINGKRVCGQKKRQTEEKKKKERHSFSFQFQLLKPAASNENEKPHDIY